jgi:manganese transport protein
LIASGLSSSAVGTIAGQVIMQGFTQYRIPLWLRRLVTIVPALSSWRPALMLPGRSS